MPARVGIVIRTKARPAFLARALSDISAQSFTDWEAVVVNDGGDPSEVAEVVSAAGLGAKVRVLDIAVGEGGRCVAANAGIRATSAPFVVLHDDDDRWDPRFLAATVEWLDEHPEDAGVVAATAIVYEEKIGDSWSEVARHPFWAGMQRISLNDMLRINRFVPISFLYRRTIHAQVGWYDETLDTVEDWDLSLRIMAQHHLGYIDGPVLAYWTQRPSARGADANSMFDLAADHRHDDQVVRDRALAAWVAREGMGLPLHLAGIENRIVERLEDLEARIEADLRSLRDDVRHEINAHQPLWSRLRRLRARLRRRR